jgi:hypothetical protein
MKERSRQRQLDKIVNDNARKIFRDNPYGKIQNLLACKLKCFETD